MKLEFHTIRYGNPDWLVACADTLDRWIDRHDYRLRIWTDQDRKPEYPHPKFCIVDMWKSLLAGDSDWLVYIDGDIYVHPQAPRMDFLQEHSGMLVKKSPRKATGRITWWGRNYADASALQWIDRWWCRNLGWFAIDREAAERLLRVVAPPYYEGTMDECQANYWMAEAVGRHGLTVTSPPREWHRYYWESGPGWMWHLARPHGKMLHLERIRQEGKVA